MDETYLDQLCAALAEGGPKVGRWTSPLRRPQSGDLHRMTFFSVEPMDLYGAADKSGLPIPPSRKDEETMQAAIEDNALAAVLTTHAVMSIRNDHPHEVGGPDLGTVLGAVPPTRMGEAVTQVLIGAVSERRPNLFSRILFHLPQSPMETVDLRTVAVLGYALAGRATQSYLRSNPSGHYPHRPDPSTGRWNPGLDFAQSFYRTRGAEE